MHQYAYESIIFLDKDETKRETKTWGLERGSINSRQERKMKFPFEIHLHSTKASTAGLQRETACVSSYLVILICNEDGDPEQLLSSCT